jgi:hypothetical protein
MHGVHAAALQRMSCAWATKKSGAHLHEDCGRTLARRSLLRSCARGRLLLLASIHTYKTPKLLSRRLRRGRKEDGSGMQDRSRESQGDEPLLRVGLRMNAPPGAAASSTMHAICGGSRGSRGGSWKKPARPAMQGPQQNIA